jgi:hypothetical protein
VTHRIWWKWLKLAASLSSFGTLILVLAAAGCQKRSAWATEDTPANRLSSLLISIFRYENTYNRCPENLGVLGPPPQGRAADSQAADFIEADLASGKHNGYVYEYRRATHSKSCEFTITTDPVDPHPGQLHYFTDDSGARRFEVDRQATATSPKYEKDN